MEPHPFYLMGSGLIVLGLGLLLFNFFAKTGNCYQAKWFVLLYMLDTIGELLLEPIGLDFINRNAPMKYATLLFVLWECNSGLAYIINGYCDINILGVLGFAVLGGGIVFIILTPQLRKFVL